MGKIRSVKFNFIMNFILTASNVLFPLVTFPYVSRILGASGNGKITFITSVASYFSMIASLGIPTYGIRECARVRDDKEKLSKTVQELIIIHSMMTVISLSLYFGSMFFVGRLYQEKELMLINGVSLILNVFGINWLYSALEQYQYITIRSICFKIMSIFLMFALVHQREDYILYGAISIFATAGANVLNFINARKHISWKHYGNYELKRHMKPIMVFFAQSVAITVYTNLDTVMLGFMKDDVEVGLYSAAVKVKGVLTTLVTSLGTVLLPRLSYYIQSSKKDEFERLVRMAVEFVLFISLPLTIFFIVMAEESILFLSGSEFIGATLAMQIIIPTIVFIGLSNVTGTQFLVSLGKEKFVLYSVIAGAVVDLILNVFCIPNMGAAGASVGTLVAEIAVLFVQLYLIKKEFGYHFFEAKKTMKLFLATFMASIPLIWIKNVTALPVVFELVITCAAFFGSYLIVCLMMRVEILQEIFSRRKISENK